jgi:hypothetical protein
MNNRIPNSKLHLLKSDLFPNLFEAQEFNRILEEFITSEQIKED